MENWLPPAPSSVKHRPGIGADRYQIDIAPDELWIRALQLDQLLLANTSEYPSVETEHHRILAFQELVERNAIL